MSANATQPMPVSLPPRRRSAVGGKTKAPTAFDSESFFVTNPLPRRPRQAATTRLLVLRRRARTLRWIVAAVVLPLAVLALFAARPEIRRVLAAPHAAPPAALVVPIDTGARAASSAAVASAAFVAPMASATPATSASAVPVVKATPAQRRHVRRKPPSSE